MAGDSSLDPVGSATAVVPVEGVEDYGAEASLVLDMVNVISDSDEGQYMTVHDNDLEDGTVEYVVELYQLP